MRKNKELGAGMVEFALVVALVATVGFASVEQFGKAVGRSMCNSAKHLGATSGPAETDGCLTYGSPENETTGATEGD